MTDTRISYYNVLEKLGEGGMGEIYKAEDTRLGRMVALKFLSSANTTREDYIKRFKQEAHAAAALNHPNICTIYSVEEHDGKPFISMEYVDGNTLRAVIDSGDLQIEEAIIYGIHIASALSAAHEKGIVHRDLKPENIMVDNKGRLKVMDFGLARMKGAQHITREENRIGTLAYMSPEQLRGDTIDHRSDLFSFGIILYEMLTGFHPFQGEYEQAISYQLMNEDPSHEHLPNENVPGIKELVLQCLEKKPADRYSSANEIINELKNYINQKPSPSTYFPNILFSTLSSRKPVFYSGAVILLILFGVLWLFDSTWINTARWENLPDEKHLVVLPFNNLSEDVIPASFSDGIVEILTSKITQIGAQRGTLWVVPNSEVRSEKITSVSEANDLFGANMAVTGSLYRSGDYFRLSLNLVDGLTKRQLDSSILEAEWTNIVHLQEEVVRTLSEMLEVELGPDVKQSLNAGNSLISQAYQLYIYGRGYLSRFEDPESIEMAIVKFEEALEIDPEYARAWAGLGEAYWRKFNLNNDVQWTQPALNYAHKALELNDRLSEVYVTLAMIYNGLGRHEDVLNMLDYLEQREKPGYEAQIELAKAYSGMGRTDQAELEYQKAIELKETYWDGYNQLGFFYYLNGQYEEAADMFKKVTEWTPDNYSAYYRLGAAFFNIDENRKAEEAFKKSLELRPNHRASSNLGTLYFHEGRFEEAILMFEQAIELSDVDYQIWGNLGLAYYGTGQNEEKVHSTISKAIELAEKMREIMPGNNLLLADLANYYAVIGNREQVDSLLSQLVSRNIQDPGIMIMIAETYEILNERSAAVSWLEKALKQGYNWEIIENNLALRHVLEEPRIQNFRGNNE
jgi:serine/threonine protein kinase/Flp pilus assembly protein TadD